MDEPTDINELFNQGKVSSQKADKTSKGTLDTASSYWNRGYAPEMVGGTVAATYGGFALKNYMKNLEAVKKAIAAEEDAIKSLREPATKSARQPFSKEGFMLSGGKDVKALMPQKKGGAIPYTRLSNIMPIGGPEGTGLGVLKGKERSTAAKMTAEQMFRYLYPQSNLAATATTPRIEVKGFQAGEAGRKTVVVTPENVKTGKLPTTAIPAGVIPAPEKSFIPRMAGKISPAMEKIAKGTLYLGEKYGQLMDNPFVKYPLRVFEGVRTPYNMYQQYDAEVARAEAEGSNFAEARGVVRGLGPLARTGINLTTAYVPEMLGTYESPEDLAKMYTGELNRIESEFVKKNKRPMTDEERQNYQDALMMSGIGFGG